MTMEASLVVLKRVLEELDPESVPHPDDTQEMLAVKHRRAQMVIHLAQSLGKIDLGYHFGWKTYLPWDEFLGAQDEQLAAEIEKLKKSLDHVTVTLRARLRHRPRSGLQQAITNLGESLWRMESATTWLRMKPQEKE